MRPSVSTSCFHFTTGRDCHPHPSLCLKAVPSNYSACDQRLDLCLSFARFLLLASLILPACLLLASAEPDRAEEMQTNQAWYRHTQVLYMAQTSQTHSRHIVTSSREYLWYKLVHGTDKSDIVQTHLGPID